MFKTMGRMRGGVRISRWFPWEERIMMMSMIFVCTNGHTRDIRVEGSTMNMSGQSMSVIGLGMYVN